METKNTKVLYGWVGSMLKTMPQPGRTSTLTRHFLNSQLRISKQDHEIEQLYSLYGGTTLKIIINQPTFYNEGDKLSPVEPEVIITVTGIAPCGSENKLMITSDREKYNVVALNEFAFARPKDYHEDMFMLMVTSNAIYVKTTLPFDDYTAEVFQKYIA